MKSIASIFTLFIFLFSSILAGTTGKLSGNVADSRTGEPLVGVNIVIVGTQMGAITDIHGDYAIISVVPGTYTVRASIIGYAPMSQTQVRIDIDQTTAINFKLQEEAIQRDEVIVVAERPVVQQDVASTRANISVKEIESLPVASVNAVVGLQAGIQSGLVIRGTNNADQTAFMVDGLTLRDERTNLPYTGISLSSIQDIQVQTGGFNAEYGNIRSGVVNVVTKEGTNDKYTFSGTLRYSPPAAKNFGQSVYNSNSYWIRPYVDPAVAFTGTGKTYDPGAWDYFTRLQYPYFEGWNAVSETTLKDADPTNDLTPEALRQLFLFQHRRQGDIVKPDWDIDMGFGGPVPVISQDLGNLRFFGSYRQSQNMYVIPLSRDSYNDYNGQIRITSDISGGMKLMIQGITGKQTGTNDNNSGLGGLFTSASEIASVLDRVSYIDVRIYNPEYFAPSTISMYSYGGKFTHVLSSLSYYEASAQYQQYKYSTNPGTARDVTKKYLFGNSYYVDEAPYGFAEATAGRITYSNGTGFSNSRDSSSIGTFTLKFDYNNQINKYNNIKTGVEFNYSNNNISYGVRDYFVNLTTVSKWKTNPFRISAYAQDKFEYEGMIASFGLRFDVSDPNGDWYVFNPYTDVFSGTKSLGIDTLLAKEKIERNVTLSPRLGVAFPVTEYSKLFFNYGHFRSMPTPENLYLVRRDPKTNRISRLAEPNNTLPKTVAYELGYEHSLFNEYLIRVAGYYKNVTDQITTVTIVGRDAAKVNYTISKPNSYEDIRGFELTLSRNRGEWITGFLNYTYMARSLGRFGYQFNYENVADQKIYERDFKTRDLYQTKPIPAPYARISVDFFTPIDYDPLGSSFYGENSLTNDWRLNLTGNWASGSYFTWTGTSGGSLIGVQYNVQYRDTWGLNMRLSKNLKFGKTNIQLFVDAQNLLNIKNFSRYGFTDGTDYENYMRSLHLEDGIVDNRFGYINIPGSDKPGDVRKEGAEYTPIVAVGNLSSVSNIVSAAIYYDASQKKYMEYKNNAWSEVESGRVGKILDDKSYIDMPNMNYFVFLNPRDIFWGIKLSFEF